MKNNQSDTKKKTQELSTLEMAKKVAEAALDMKATDIKIIKLPELAAYTDFIVIASGNSSRQAQSIAENMQVEIKKLGRKPIGVEGEQEGNWVLVDWGEIISHVFYSPVREFYELEKLFSDTQILCLGEDGEYTTEE